MKKKPFTVKDIDKLKEALHKAGAKPIKNNIYYTPVNTNTLIKYIKPDVMRKIVLFAIRSGINLHTGEFKKEMNLEKDKKYRNRFWFGKGEWDWVNLEFPIIKIEKNIIITEGGNFEVYPDPETKVKVCKIT